MQCVRATCCARFNDENTRHAVYALIVDAKDEQAAAFYRHHGFIALQSNPLALFLPLATAKDLLERKN